MNTPYKKGYRFQRRVKKYLESLGWQVIVRPKSKFPDLHCWKKDDIMDTALWVIIEVECKMNKYLSKDEKKKAEAIKKRGIPFYVAWKDKKRKIRLEER
jgi:Holliday junction resolvase